MAKILITFSAVLLAVVYVSYAAPSLSPNLFQSEPVPMSGMTFPGVSAACNTVVESSQKSCNETIIAKMFHSKMMKEMNEALDRGDRTKGQEIMDKIRCCTSWALLDCMEADVKNKCSKNDADMINMMMGIGKTELAKKVCPKYPDSSKCEE